MSQWDRKRYSDRPRKNRLLRHLYHLSIKPHNHQPLFACNKSLKYLFYKEQQKKTAEKQWNVELLSLTISYPNPTLVINISGYLFMPIYILMKKSMRFLCLLISTRSREFFCLERSILPMFANGTEKTTIYNIYMHACMSLIYVYTGGVNV